MSYGKLRQQDLLHFSCDSSRGEIYRIEERDETYQLKRSQVMLNLLLSLDPFC